MERSHIPLSTWLLAFHLMSSSKKGFSAHQMHREFELDYKSAWFMAHRIREAMKRPPLVDKLTGTIEADETYVGGKPRAYEKGTPGRPGRRNRKKTPVFTLVQRGGDVRSFPVWQGNVTGNNLKAVIREQVDREAKIFTDELTAYVGLRREFAEWDFVTHSRKEYVRGDVHVNTAEGYFSILKRGINGTYHHVSREHLQRYLDEFSFRYSTRKLTDSARLQRIVDQARGRRLSYKPLTDHVG